MALLVRVVVKDDQPTPAVVNDVVIHVYSAAGALLATGTTGQGADPAGEYSLSLTGSGSPGTEYHLRMRKPNVTFTKGATQKIFVIEPLVPATPNIFDISVHAATRPTSSDADMCRLSGYVVDARLRALTDARLRISSVPAFPDGQQSAGGLHYLGDPTVVRDRMLIGAVRTVTPSSAGFFDLLLPRKGVFDVQLHGAEHPLTGFQRIYVPDAADWALEDVLFPYVKQVDYGASPVALTVGQTKTLTINVHISDGRQLSELAVLGSILEFKASDAAIAKVVFDKDGLLSITGLKIGSTTVVVSRVKGSFAPRRPVVNAVTATPPTLQVT